ncbi:MAG: type II toxin-antitoxin system RelE/ParE family toxin [Deltaproteobacteria bacterium]|nr:type II toxin-antitoxin system RelE/ParE family toxin [Deltaproteobacteria bacterium]
MEAPNAAHRLHDLRVPPPNRREKLKGRLHDFYAIGINDRWRLVFKWEAGNGHEVRIIDYH